MADMKRLQGTAWTNLRKKTIIGYYESKRNKRIKVFATKNGVNTIFYHWLNDTQIVTFEKNKHKYPIMNNSGEIVASVNLCKAKRIVEGLQKLVKENYGSCLFNEGTGDDEIEGLIGGIEPWVIKLIEEIISEG